MTFSEKRYLVLPTPSEEDFRAARERILAELEDGTTMTLPVLRTLYPLVQNADYRVTVTLCPNDTGMEVVYVEAGDTVAEHYGLALDIGSTTMQMELLDMNSGTVRVHEECFNAQNRFGDNILDRILAVRADRKSLAELQELTLSCVRELIARCCKKADVDPASVACMTVGGNTTMIHFFLGCDPWLVFQAPYAPAFFFPGTIPARELGLPIAGNVFCFPAVANYLGGDIMSGLLETDLDTREDLAAFLDIGTNGELVIGNRDFLVMGAGAAGPALEGDVSVSGMRAEPGAVCRVTITDENELLIQTIADAPAKGICGSGIFDLIAQGYLAGWIDSAGHIDPKASECIHSVWDEEKQHSVNAIVYAHDGDRELYFTEDDIAELLACKAAAHTMVETLLQYLELDGGDIGTFYLSGGFGTYYDIESAITIGLYPDLPREKFRVLGNSSLAGARRLLLDRGELARLKTMLDRASYIQFGELDRFVENMNAARFIPNTDFSQYPSVERRKKERGHFRTV